jgi:hypothetical protein
VFGLTLEFRRELVSKRILFDTPFNISHFPEEAGYRSVSKPVSKSKYQNLTNFMGFDTLVV